MLAAFDPPPPSRARPTRGVTTLVVDDDADVRGSLRQLLAIVEDVHVVGEAASGEEAIERTDELLPRVVIMDWAMPGMDGSRATRSLLERHPDVVVLGWTSSDDAYVHELFRRAGALDVIVKGDVDRLLAWMARLAASSRE